MYNKRSFDNSNSRFSSSDSCECIPLKGGHQVLTYQTTRECLLGSLLNSNHIQRTGNKECPEKSVRKSIQRVQAFYFAIKTPYFTVVFQEMFKRSCGGVRQTRSSDVALIYFVQRVCFVKLASITNVTSVFKFQKKAFMDNKNL